MLTDLRLALRTIARAPLTSLGAVLMLAVGIGVMLAALGTLDGFLWRPLPYPQAERLVGIARVSPPLSLFQPVADVATGEVVRQRVRALEDVAIAQERSVRVRADAGTIRRNATWTTPNAFRMLGVRPILGRVPERAIGDDGAAEVALGEHFWRHYLGGRPDVVGATLMVDGEMATVVGVMPAGFQYHFRSDLWLAFDRSALLHAPAKRLLTMGRLREGATLEQARAQASALEAELPVHEALDEGRRLYVHHEIVIRNAIPEPLARLIFGVASLVLVVGCANVANLLLVRTLTRRSELAVRAALGGGAAALVRPGLVHASVIAALGGSLGFLLAAWGNMRIAVVLGARLPDWAVFQLDARFVVAAIVATGLVVLATAVPAMHLSRRTDVTALIASSGYTLPPHMGRFSRIALVVQVAIMCAVTIVAVRVFGTYRELATLDRGFPADSLLAAELVTADAAIEPSAEQWGLALDEMTSRLAGMPEVAGATHLWHVARTTDAAADPRDGSLLMSDTLFTGEKPWEPVRFRIAGPTQARAVGESFFDVTGIGLVAGRGFTMSDRRGGEPVAVLSRALAEALWPDSPAVGRRLRLGPAGPWVSVVGLAGDVRTVRASGWEGTIVGPEYTIYMPRAQALAFHPTLLVRPRSGAGAAGSPLALAPLVVSVAQGSPLRLQVERLRTYDQDLSKIAEERRVLAFVLGGCAVAVLGLGALGLFAMLAFYSALRLPEMGIRSALGASTRDLARELVLPLRPILVRGVVGGMLLTLVISKLLSAMVSDRGGGFLVALALAAVILAITVISASAPVVRHVARLAPMTVIRDK